MRDFRSTTFRHVLLCASLLLAAAAHAAGQLALSDSLAWTSPTVAPTLPLSAAVLAAQNYLGSNATPDQATFVQITSTSSSQQPIPTIVFYGWRLHYTNVQLGAGNPANLVLLINGGDAAAGGWPSGALVAVQIDRSVQSGASRVR